MRQRGGGLRRSQNAADDGGVPLTVLMMPMVSSSFAVIARWRRRSGDSEPPSKSASAQVCVLLPDTKSSVRWSAVRRAVPRRPRSRRGVSTPIHNAHERSAEAEVAGRRASPTARRSSSLDRARHRLGAAITKRRESQGAQGRSTTTARSSAARPRYYVSFDNAGRRPAGQGRRRGLRRRASTQEARHRRAERRPSPTTTRSSSRAGYDSVLNPLYKNGTFKKGPRPVRTDWDNQKAGDDLRADARRQQQDRRRRWRRTTASPARSSPSLKATAEADPADRSGRDADGRPVHHRRAGRRDRLQVGQRTRRKAAARGRSTSSRADGRRRTAR